MHKQRRHKCEQQLITWSKHFLPLVKIGAYQTLLCLKHPVIAMRPTPIPQVVGTKFVWWRSRNISNTSATTIWSAISGWPLHHMQHGGSSSIWSKLQPICYTRNRGLTLQSNSTKGREVWILWYQMSSVYENKHLPLSQWPNRTKFLTPDDYYATTTAPTSCRWEHI